MAQFPVILLNDLGPGTGSGLMTSWCLVKMATSYFALSLSPFWPYSDVIKPRPLRPSPLWDDVSWTGVERRREFEKVSCTQCTGQGDDFELTPTVKMETRHPVDGYFGSEFPKICNQCGLRSYRGLKSQEVEIFWEIFAFKKTYGKIFKILFRKFSPRHRSACCVQISWNLADGKSVKSCVTYLIKEQISPGCPTIATAWIAPKICQASLLQCTQSAAPDYIHPNRFTFGGVIAKRVNAAKTRRKVNPVFGWSLASSRIIRKTQ